MSTDLILPKFNMDMEEATLLRWLRAEGDQVAEGDPVCEVETDKVNMEVEAPVGGVLTGLRYREGDRIPVTAVIARIAADRDEARRLAASDGQAPAGAGAAPGARAALAVDRPPHADRAPAASPPTDAGTAVTAASVAEVPLAPGKVRATPAARRIAREHGIELAPLAGRDGRVSIEAVRSAVARQAAAPAGHPPTPRPAAAPPAAAPPAAPAPAFAARTVELDSTRRRIAERMVTAHAAPHITLDTDVRMDALAGLRRDAFGSPPSFTALFAVAVAWALGDHPALNATLEDGRLTLHPTVDLGIAVDRPGGLIVPVLRGVQGLTVPEASRRLAALVERAREGRVRLEEVTGGTFTITSLGELGVDRFSPLVNPPQVAILGIGRIAPRVVPVTGGIGVASMVTLSLTCDHRVVDGAPGARFLATLRGLLEEPAWMASLG